jgi:hypothetical protein
MRVLKRYFVQGAGLKRSIIRLTGQLPWLRRPAAAQGGESPTKVPVRQGALRSSSLPEFLFRSASEVGAGNPAPSASCISGPELAGMALFHPIRIRGFDYGIWSTISQVQSDHFEHVIVEQQNLASIFNISRSWRFASAAEPGSGTGSEADW